ncbi:DNA polymerase III subunit alpha [Magnetofaba australis]|nr:DNA polymerase III subunit alpha [Magnetofaba australis]
MAHAGFVHLHVHTGYSLLDATTRPKALIARAKEQRMPALALTDHGNLFAAIPFYSDCLKAGLKPILGAQLYLVPDHSDKNTRPDQETRDQLVLLCRDLIGWRSLMRLISLGHLEGSHGKPRIDMAQLRENAAGLLCLSGGKKGGVGRLLLAGKLEEARALADQLATLFGRDGEAPNFHIELQRCGERDDETYNQAAMELAYELNLPLIASNEVHYMDPDDQPAQDALFCVGDTSTLYAEKRQRISKGHHFASPEEMAQKFADVPEAIHNTLLAAQRCNLQLQLGKPMLPDFELPEGEDLVSWLTHECKVGLQKRLDNRALEHIEEEQRAEVAKRYWERLDYELGIIVQMGFPGYFLIVSDFIKWAKRQDIPVGPGRGSGAGSLVAWALEITDLDPIRYTLLFERFLNPERVSMPDFDVDFCMDRREEVIHYVQEKYGADRVAQIITFGTMQAKAVVRDMGRVMEMPYGRVDKIAKLIPNVLGIKLSEAIAQEERLRYLMDDEPEVRQLMEMALALEGSPRSCGTHAAGVVISNGPLTDTVPLYRDPRSPMPVTQFNMSDVEKAGLVKFDFLGLKTLTVIDNAIKIINGRSAVHGEEPIDIAHIDIDDRAAYKLLQDGKTRGVFQLESSGMRDILKKLAPDTFEDIVALVALYRPGPLGSGMVDDFINRKHGRTQVEYPLPQLEPILKETYGVILYQEQVMKIAQVLAGYTLGGADLLRRAMGKKKPEEMARQREIFMEGAKTLEINTGKAEYIFDLMEKFAGYGFNKSHSAAYALVSYQTAWLKAHHKEAFMTATLTADMQNTDKVMNFIRECRDLGIPVLPPDVNHSQVDFAVEETDDGALGVRYGLAAIKNVGEAAMESVVKARSEGGPFESLLDLCRRAEAGGLNKRMLENLIKAGACDALCEGNRHALMLGLPEAMSMGARHQEDQKHGVMNLFDDVEEDGDDDDAFGAAWRPPEAPEWSEEERLNQEKAALGFYISSHPLKRYEEELTDYGLDNIATLKEKHENAYQQPRDEEGRIPVAICGVLAERKLHRTRKGDRMMFFTLEDMYGQVEGVVFPDTYNSSREILESDDPVVIIGAMETDGEEPKITTERVRALETFRSQKCQELRLETPATALSEKTMADLEALLTEHQSNAGCQVALWVRSESAKVGLALGPNFRVQPSDALLDALIRQFGPDSARFRSVSSLRQ